MTEKEIIRYYKRSSKRNQAWLKQSCRKMDNLLNKLNEYWENKRKGHNPPTEPLEKAYAQAEEFLDNIDWESL